MAASEYALAPRPPSRNVRIKRVLIIDRDDSWYRASQEMLVLRGYRVSRAVGVEDARRQVLERPPDLVLLSASVGEILLNALAEDFRGRPLPPLMLVVAGREGPGSKVEGVSVLRLPHTSEELGGAVAALIGSPWARMGEGA
jgi:PleD family two-component response regulator